MTDGCEKNQILDASGKVIMHVKPKIEVEYGGCLRAIIDGKPQNIADYMNAKEREKNDKTRSDTEND